MRRPDFHRIPSWLLLGLCVFFAWHGVHAGLRARGSDFTVFYRAGRAVLEGRDPSQVERFLYLPAFAVASAPLALLPYALALILWQVASLAALAWIVSACRRICARELGRSFEAHGDPESLGERRGQLRGARRPALERARARGAAARRGRHEPVAA